jgi:hypothetical protein
MKSLEEKLEVLKNENLNLLEVKEKLEKDVQILKEEKQEEN